MSFILDSKTNTDLISLSLCNYVMIIQKYEASLPHHPSFSNRLGLNTKNCRYKIIYYHQSIAIVNTKNCRYSHKYVVRKYENISRFHVINVTIFQLTDFTSFLHCKMDEARDKMKDSKG
jgi:hypothetical protein